MTASKNAQLSLRGRGLGRLMVALHRLEALDRLGDHMMFGTTILERSGSWTGNKSFHATAEVRMSHDAPVEQQAIRLWTRDDLILTAARIISDGIQPPDQPWARP